MLLEGKQKCTLCLPGRCACPPDEAWHETFVLSPNLTFCSEADERLPYRDVRFSEPVVLFDDTPDDQHYRVRLCHNGSIWSCARPGTDERLSHIRWVPVIPSLPAIASGI